MTKMKGLIVTLALFIGIVSCVGTSHAGGRQNQGWYVTVATGIHTTVFLGKGFVRAIYLTTGTVTSLGDYAMGLVSTPTAANGADQSILTGGPLFQSSAAATPALVFKTTTTISSAADNLNNNWKMGDGLNDFLEVNNFFLRKSCETLGEACKAFIYWSR